MRQKTIQLRREVDFLSDVDVEKIWSEVSVEQQDRLIIAIDGAPGTGKSVLAEKLQRIIESSNVEVGTVPTDLDCLPRAERPSDSSLMDWHENTITREVVLYPGADFLYTGYDSVTHRRTKEQRILSPKNGVLIVEGLHSIEYVRENTNQAVIAIIFQMSDELREIRRAERNVRQGRWKAEEVESRTVAQRSSAIKYYKSLSRELDQTSVNVRNVIRCFK